MSKITNILNTTNSNFSNQLEKLVNLPQKENQEIKNTVTRIISQIKKNGDLALLKFTNKFDRLSIKNPKLLEIPKSKLKKAERQIPRELYIALNTARNRLQQYHLHQKYQGFSYQEGKGTLSYRIQPLTRVALYVPGGKASYPSSLLMNAIPAKIAGVKELIILNPTPNGEINPVVLACASLVKVDRLFTIGGAQAVAAVAFGTRSIPQCDKIVGPGNAYVVEAKRQLFGKIGIDMLAGPSELIIINDGSGNPDWIAADLLAQAEHDENAQSILLTTDQNIIDQVEISIRNFLPKFPRSKIINRSLKNRGALILVKNLTQAISIANQIAPEHLAIATDFRKNPPNKIARQIKYAGAIFLGHHSCEVLGDYCAGTNHILPTSGSARFSSPLSVHDFYKATSILNLDIPTVNKIAGTAEILAESEGLQAHALAANLRKKLSS